MALIGTIDTGECPLILAPMEEITDSPFRSLCKRFGAGLLITEFIASEALVREAEKSHAKMKFGEDERPIGIQIFGSSVENMERAAAIAAEQHPDFIDINFGCPVRKIVMKGGGAALLNDIPKMVRMTEAVVRSTKLPVTVKTRLGWDEDHKNIVDIAERMQDAGIRAISIHGRTRAQLYGGRADWTLIGKVKNNPRMVIPVFGNGDITGPVIARELKERYSVDGLMIGRAAIGNPWIFRETRNYLDKGILSPPPQLKERIAILKEHLQRTMEHKGERRGMLEFRKFYSGYLKGFPGIKPYRMRLVTAVSHPEILDILDELTPY